MSSRDQIRITIVYLSGILLNESGVPRKKALFSLAAQACKCFSSRKPSSFGLQKRFMHASHFIPQNMKKMGTQGRDRSLIHDFYYFVKDILK